MTVLSRIGILWLCVSAAWCLILFLAAVFLALVDRIRAHQEAVNLDEELHLLLWLEGNK